MLSSGSAACPKKHSNFKMSTIASVVVLAPVTALEVVGDTILSGEASYLRIYNLTSGKCLHQTCILGRHVIHGIRKGEDSLFAVFGQKALSVVCIKFGADENEVSLSVPCEVTKFPDWILDAAFLQKEDRPSSTALLGLVLAHNTIMLWDWKQRICLQHVHSAENCILYSARILGNSWDTVIIAAGTVFNQVVLWRPNGLKDDTGRVPVEQRLCGHEGVIFNLSYHTRHKLLCSVSDDRSVRLWCLDLENTPRKQNGTAQQVMYGHSARVWDAKILDETIVSVGEDAVCCVWDYSGTLMHKFTGHMGQSIWSVAVHESQKIIITGGGDSGIRVWSLATQQEHSITTMILEVQTDAGDILSESGMLASDSSHQVTGDSERFHPRQLAVLNSGQIVIMTQNGCLLRYALESKEWCLLSHDPNYQSYSLLSVNPLHKLAALGNIHGNVKILALDTGRSLLEIEMFKGKVFSMYWADEDSLLISGPDGIVIWTRLREAVNNYRLEEEARFTLPEAPQRWLTTAILVPHQEGALVCGDRRGSLLLYTDLYDSTQTKLPARPKHSLPGIHGKAGVTQVCYHGGFIYSTGRDGTYRQYRLQGTRLDLMNTFKVSKGFSWIERLSFTSDGDIWVYGFHESRFIVWSKRSNEPLVQIKCGGGHRAWGFATCHLADRLSHQPHTQGANAPTPGNRAPSPGNRAPSPGDRAPSPGDRAPSPGDNSPTPGAATGGNSSRDTMAVFACIKAKKIEVCSAPGEKLRQNPIIKESLHGRKITCIKHLATVTLPRGECAVCATGSEDNAVNIVAIMFPQCKSSTMHILHRLQVHISSIRGLAVCLSSGMGDLHEVAEVTEPCQRLLLFSVGGRRAIQCWRVTVPTHCPHQDVAPDWLKSTCIVEHLASYGNTDNPKQRRWLKRHGLPSDPETRFMSVCVWRRSDLIGQQRSEVIVAVAGSDAFIRLFSLNEQTKSFNLLVSTDWHKCCLLTTVCIELDCPWGVCPILLTAGTNGKIAVWDIQTAIGEYGKDVQSCESEDSDSSIDETASDAQFEGSSQISNSQANNFPIINKLQSCTISKIQSNNEQENTSNKKKFDKECEHLSWQTEDHRQAASEESNATRYTQNGFGRLLLSVTAHQSGVNALCIRKVNDDHYLVASGGDDNSIHFALMHITCDKTSQRVSAKLVNTHSIRSAHAAQITGLRFLNASTLISSSVDQRINVWDVRLTPDKTSVIQVAQIASEFSLIADCADLVHWTSSGRDCIAVCGQGLQVFCMKQRTDVPHATDDSIRTDKDLQSGSIK